MIMGRFGNEIEVKSIEAFDNLTLLVTFDNDEQRIFDLEDVLDRPIFRQLEDIDKFMTARVRNGVVTWLNGTIDLAPQTMYRLSYEYDTSELIEAPSEGF